MEHHIRQATHNLKLHRVLCSHCPDEYYDWKVTILFYAALHWIRALAQKRRIKMGHSHYEIERSCNPAYHGAMPVSVKAWEEYDYLSKRSRVARYSGVDDVTTFRELHLRNHSLSLIGIHYLRKYMQGRGIETTVAGEICRE